MSGIGRDSTREGADGGVEPAGGQSGPVSGPGVVSGPVVRTLIGSCGFPGSTGFWESIGLLGPPGGPPGVFA
jgi:hypothetical protein